MKYLNKIAFLLIFCFICFSCEKPFGDYLEKAPGVDVTENTIFSSRTELETFLASGYYWGMNNDLAVWDERDKSDAPIASATEESETVAPWFWTNRTWNTGNLTSTSQADMRWLSRWKAIRIVNIIMERVDEVPADQTYLNQVRGEALFLRALNYFELFKHYGGVPIVDHRFQLEEDFLVPRSSLSETLDFIIKDCDDAVANLPANFPSEYRGRATKLAALALKAETLLFAASPQFNSVTPFMDFPGHENLICFGNYDANRWQLAADAAKEVLDAAPTSNCFLVTNQGTDKNYKYSWETMDNSEIIIADKAQGNRWWQYFLPPSFGGLMGNTVTFNFVKYYEKKDGTPQTWSMDGGNDLSEKYAQLDPRFKQTIAYNGSYWDEDHPKIVTTTVPKGRDAEGCLGGAWLRKPVPDVQKLWQVETIANWPVFKLNEMYLNYAEALNEAQGPVQEAYGAVNTIRERSGMPDFPSGLTKEQFREKLRNERAIELAYDGKRIFDERRWLIADQEGNMKGNMWGIKIYEISGSTEFRYEPYVFEQRTFYKRMYLHPFMQSEIDKGYLIQNPGY